MFTRRDVASRHLTDGDQEILKKAIESSCSKKVNWNQKEEVIFLSAVNILRSVNAFLGNTLRDLILVTLHIQGNFTSSTVQTSDP